MTAPAFAVREATPADLPALRELLSERDGAEYGLAAVTRLFAGLDPAQCRAWLAEVDGRPAGVTAMLIRQVLDARQRLTKVAYWTNLFVRSEYGRLMVYPVLVHSMLKAVHQDGLDWCYTVMRRPKVLSGHLKLGFVEIGEIPVLARPLRPLRLVARRFPRWGGLAAFGGVVDGPVRLLSQGAARLARGGLEIEELEWPEASDGLFEWIAAAYGRDTRVCTAWTPASLRARGSLTLEHSPMLLLVAREQGRVVGALPYRLGRRDGVAAAVAMDLWTQHGGAARALLHAAADRGAERGADVLLWLGGDSTRSAALRYAGFVPTPERYKLIVWPKQALTERGGAPAMDAWRFTFADHDAF